MKFNCVTPTYEKLLERNIPDLDNLPPEKIGEAPLCFSSGYTLPIGRGSAIIDLEAWVPPEFTEDRWRGPCKEIFNHIQISPSGQLCACCGMVDRSIPYFYAGSVLENDLLEVFKIANKSILYNWLALFGPSGIMEYIKNQDSTIHFQGRYVQSCQLCQEIFSDDRKAAIVFKGLKSMSKMLGIYRCLFEAQRSAFVENLSGKKSK